MKHAWRVVLVRPVVEESLSPPQQPAVSGHAAGVGMGTGKKQGRTSGVLPAGAERRAGRLQSAKKRCSLQRCPGSFAAVCRAAEISQMPGVPESRMYFKSKKKKVWGGLLHHKYQFAANFQLPSMAEVFSGLRVMVLVASVECCEKEFVGRHKFLAEGATSLPAAFSTNSCRLSPASRSRCR